MDAASRSPHADARLTPARRGRDAAATQADLLHAALQRFTRAGYDGTSTRAIADDAGVNVALISRYFGSKEGLFLACLHEAGRALVDAAQETAEGGTGTRATDQDDPSARVARAISRLAIGAATSREPHALLLLLRSSGVAAAEELRLAMLGRYAQALASSFGSSAQADPERLLRAQIALATAGGIALLRASEGLTPLADATQDELFEPVHDVVAALLL